MSEPSRFTETLYNRIITTARVKCPDPIAARDIAHDVVVKFLDRKTLKQTVDQAIIDALRSEGLIEKRGVRTDALAPINRGYETSEEPFFYNGLKDERDFLIDLDRKIADLTERERVLFLLKHVWGFCFDELAYLFGASEFKIRDTFRYQLAAYDLSHWA